MIKRLALLTLLATPMLHAQQPAPAAAAPAMPLVTYDVTGTFPANQAVSRFTAPHATFLLEVTFKQTVYAYTFGDFFFNTNPVSATYSYEGQTYPANGGTYGVQGGYWSTHSLGVTFPGGFSLAFDSTGAGPGRPDTTPVLLPFSIFWGQEYGGPNFTDIPGSVTFLAGDAGAPAYAWPLTFKNPAGRVVSSLVKITDVVGRIVLPPPNPLATR